MKVIIYGASGMVGQGVLRECLLASDVDEVLVVVRQRLALEHPKLQQLVCQDLFDLASVKGRLQGYDACLFCLGVSTSDTDAAGFKRINYDLPMATAKALVQSNPQMVFIYVSGGGTDSSENGPVMWARVKGMTENGLQKVGLRAVYLFRPGFILPMHGEQSKTRILRLLYSYFGWAFALWRKLAPAQVLDTERIGLAMLQLVRHGSDKAIQESADIAQLARYAVQSS